MIPDSVTVHFLDRVMVTAVEVPPVLELYKRSSGSVKKVARRLLVRLKIITAGGSSLCGKSELKLGREI